MGILVGAPVWPSKCHVERMWRTVSIYCWAVATSPWKPTGKTSHMTYKNLRKEFPSSIPLDPISKEMGEGSTACSQG